MQRSEKRILTTHVGSLIRPTKLDGNDKTARAENAVSRAATTEQLVEASLLREAVTDVMKRQVAVGLDVINDGEFGKSSWAAYILERISGFEVRKDQLRPLDWLGRDRERFAEFFKQEMPFALTGVPTEACIGPIKYRDDGSVRRDIDNVIAAKASARPNEVFMTAVAPASTAYNGVNEYYDSEHDFVFAIAAALREEYLAIHKAGFVLQVDDAVLANMYDFLVEQSPHRYREWAQLRIDALNFAIEGIPADRIRYHVCFGSWHVPHVADAPIANVIDLVMQVNAGAYSIEAANVRHEHEWRIWETVKLPKDKILIPGVVTHHTTTVEHPQTVADRIVRFAKLLGPENVIAGTDCGFAQSAKTQRVHPQVMWAKLESLVEGARLASKELY